MKSEKIPVAKRALTEGSEKILGKSSRRTLSEVFVTKKEFSRLEEKVDDFRFLQETLYKNLMSRELGVSVENIKIPSKPYGVTGDESLCMSNTPAVGTSHPVGSSRKMAEIVETMRRLVICGRVPRKIDNNTYYCKSPKGKGKFVPKIKFTPTPGKMPPSLGTHSRLSNICLSTKSSTSSSCSSSSSSSSDSSI